MATSTELRFLDQAYAQGGQVGLMMQTLLETGARVSEFVALRIGDVTLAERVITIEDGKGGKRREVPIGPELARLLALYIGRRRAGPLFVSRQKTKGGLSRVYTRQRVGQVVRRPGGARRRCRRRDHQAHLPILAPPYRGHQPPGARHGHH